MFKEIFIKRKSIKPGLFFHCVFKESIFKDAGGNTAPTQRATVLRLLACVASLCKRRRRRREFLISSCSHAKAHRCFQFNDLHMTKHMTLQRCGVLRHDSNAQTAAIIVHICCIVELDFVQFYVNLERCVGKFFFF